MKIRVPCGRSQILAFTVYLISVCSCALAGTTVTVGDPNNPAALRDAIGNAYKSGATTVVVAPGYYTLSAPESLYLDHWKNSILSCYGCTFLSTDTNWNGDLLTLDHCTNTTVEGGTLTSVDLSMWEGKITSLTDKNHFTVALVPGYPAPKTGWGKGIWLIGGSSRQYMPRSTDYGATITLAGPGTYTIAITQNTLPAVPAIGDYVVGRASGGPYHIAVWSGTGCTLKDIVLYENGFASLREDTSTQSTFDHLIWAAGPPPPGAMDPPLFSCGADGSDALADIIGPVYENCQMLQLLNDDDIAIHGYTWPVSTVDGATVTFKDSLPSGNDLAVGQPLRFADEKFYAQAIVESINHNKGIYTVSLDKDYHIPTDCHAFSPDACGANYKILNCLLGGTRARGIIAKADNGLIEGNTLLNSAISAVRVGSDGWDDEAGFASNVVVRDNVIDGSGSYDGALHVGNPGAVGNFNYVFENNVVNEPNGPSVTVDGASGVLYAHNVFANTSQFPFDEHLIDVKNSSNVTLTNNLLTNPGPLSASPDYEIDSSSSRIDTSGVTTGTLSNGIYTINKAGEQWFDAATAGPNLVRNFSFEDDNGQTQNPVDWTISTPLPGSASVDSSQTTEDGSYDLVLNDAASSHAKVAQKVINLLDGRYTLSAYVEGGGNMALAFMFATGFSAETTTLRVKPPPTTGSWSRITIPNIPVTDGECTIGFYGLAAGAGSSFCVDNVIFTRHFAAPEPIDLTANLNEIGIAADGTAPAAGGFNGAGSAISNNLLGARRPFEGAAFRFQGGLRNYNVVTCDGSAVAFPPSAYTFSKMYVLAAAVNGPQSNQNFTINYSTGDPGTITQSVSDWESPSNFFGETKAVSLSHRVSPDGTAGTPVYLYGYAFPLDKTRTPLDVLLPMNSNLKILAITLAP